MGKPMMLVVENKEINGKTIKHIDGEIYGVFLPTTKDGENNEVGLGVKIVPTSETHAHLCISNMRIHSDQVNEQNGLFLGPKDIDVLHAYLTWAKMTLSNNSKK